MAVLQPPLDEEFSWTGRQTDNFIYCFKMKLRLCLHSRPPLAESLLEGVWSQVSCCSLTIGLHNKLLVVQLLIIFLFIIIIIIWRGSKFTDDGCSSQKHLYSLLSCIS